ncbi:MAG: SGNH/GDSL hydrolase family protein [Chitinophagaceae bacterium]|nr:SGNH/GDSL hydrolase family protein [Chitinophagaceae bacterium]
MIRLLVLVCCLLCAMSEMVSAQKRIVLIGSSTTAGVGASADTLKWAARLQTAYRSNASDGVDTFVERGLAFSGFFTYNTMPSSFVAPANRAAWPIDPNRNVTKALSLSPDIVIISLPSNDINLNPAYMPKETMDNFRLMYQTVTAAGVKCFITTTQPRHDVDLARRLLLRDLRDSIMNTFGAYAIDFYTDLVTNNGLCMLRPELAADQVHPNDEGHRLLFQRIMEKNIFSDLGNAPLPLSLTEFKVIQSTGAVTLFWQTDAEDPNTWFDIERSANGSDFTKIHTLKAVSSGNRQEYRWNDSLPLDGNNYYRLGIREDLKVSYSKIIGIRYTTNPPLISTFNFRNGNVEMEINSSNSEAAIIRLLNSEGRDFLLKKVIAGGPVKKVVLPVGYLPGGIYLLNIRSKNGINETRQFTVH